MPLKPATSKKNRKENYLELISGRVGSARQKAIRTLMKRRKISYEKAKEYQAKVIAFGKKKKHGR